MIDLGIASSGACRLSNGIKSCSSIFVQLDIAVGGEGSNTLTSTSWRFWASRPRSSARSRGDTATASEASELLRAPYIWGQRFTATAAITELIAVVPGEPAAMSTPSTATPRARHNQFRLPPARLLLSEAPSSNFIGHTSALQQRHLAPGSSGIFAVAAPSPRSKFLARKLFGAKVLAPKTNSDDDDERQRATTSVRRRRKQKGRLRRPALPAQGEQRRHQGVKGGG